MENERKEVQRNSEEEWLKFACPRLYLWRQSWKELRYTWPDKGKPSVSEDGEGETKGLK
ncbi:hypothetical protein [Rhizobium sp. R339]|uniref:hypothetical protein n=1 Tax=Rhizobium sp. R339 TaxID=1764273 RepID=UPI00167E0848|nr:hypothetical protein [Rhizobium sp. R339]